MKKLLFSFSLILLLIVGTIFSACSNEDEPQPAPGGNPGGETQMESVDLGLSVRWASCNMGAGAPYEAGGYYGWADPTGEATTAQVLDTNQNWTSPLYGGADPVPDICRTIYDLPHTRLGGCWRLPSEAEAQELIDRCTWRKETLGGVAGYRVTGPNGNSIFLPMAGMRQGNEYYMQGQRGYYWTGTRKLDGTGATSLWVGIGNKAQISNDYRYQGCSIRPVLGTDSTTMRYDSPLDTVDRRVDMGILADNGEKLYWASGNLIVRRYARSYIAHEPTFVPATRIFSQTALEWDLFSWGDATGRIQYYSPEWERLNVNSLPDNISGDERYDVARARLGGKWRLPTETEWQRLLDSCDASFRIPSGQPPIMELTSRVNGNKLTLYGSGYYECNDAIDYFLFEGYAAYLTGNRKWVIFSVSRGSIDGRPVSSVQSYIWANDNNMLSVRPVTE